MAGSAGRRKAARSKHVELPSGEYGSASTPALPPTELSAWDDPISQEWIKTWRNRAIGGLLLLAAALLVGFAVPTAVAFHDSSTLEQALTTRGVVLDGAQEYGTRQSWVNVRYRVNSLTHIGTLHGPGPDRLPEGTKIKVFYDPGDPSRFRTEEFANHGDDFVFWTSWGLARYLFIFAVPGATAVGKRRGFRKAMKHAPWEVWRARQRTAGVFRARPMLHLTRTLADGETEHVLVRLNDIPGRSRRFYLFRKPKGNALRIPDGTLVVFCAGKRRRGVVASEAYDQPYLGKRAKNARQHQLWATMFERGSR